MRLTFCLKKRKPKLYKGTTRTLISRKFIVYQAFTYSKKFLSFLHFGKFSSRGKRIVSITDSVDYMPSHIIIITMHIVIGACASQFIHCMNLYRADPLKSTYSINYVNTLSSQIKSPSKLLCNFKPINIKGTIFIKIPNLLDHYP